MTNKLTLIGGAGFYATCAVIQRIAELQKMSIKRADSDFPSFNVLFDNQLSIDFKGCPATHFKLDKDVCYLCFSGHPSFEEGPASYYSLLNPRWYKTSLDNKKVLVLCSQYSAKNKKFSHIPGLTLCYPTDEEQATVSDCIEKLALTGVLDEAKINKLQEILKKYGTSHEVSGVLLGCTEFLMLDSKILDPFIIVNPVQAILEELFK